MSKFVDEAQTAASFAAANAQMEANWDRATAVRDAMRKRDSDALWAKHAKKEARAKARDAAARAARMAQA